MTNYFILLPAWKSRIVECCQGAFGARHGRASQQMGWMPRGQSKRIPSRVTCLQDVISHFNRNQSVSLSQSDLAQQPYTLHCPYCSGSNLDFQRRQCLLKGSDGCGCTTDIHSATQWHPMPLRQRLVFYCSHAQSGITMHSDTCPELQVSNPANNSKVHLKKLGS
jgi:hypothetical protein